MPVAFRKSTPDEFFDPSVNPYSYTSRRSSGALTFAQPGVKGSVPVTYQRCYIATLLNCAISGDFPIVFDYGRGFYFNAGLTHRDYDSLWHINAPDYYSGAQTAPWCQIDSDGTLRLHDRDTVHYRGRYVFLGGSKNFGHNLWEWMTRLDLALSLHKKYHKQLVIYEDSSLAESFLREIGVRSNSIVKIRRNQLAYFDEISIIGAPFYRDESRQLVIDPERFFALRQLLSPKITAPNNPGIYISRNDAKFRKLLDEASLVAMLENLGIKTMNPSEISLREQINLASTARVVISQMGAGSALSAFASASSLIIELTPSANIFGAYCGILSALMLGQSFFRIEGSPDQQSVSSGTSALYWNYRLPRETLRLIQSITRL